MIRRRSRLNMGKAAMNSPSPKRMRERRTTWRNRSLRESPRASRLPKEKGMATPTMNRKKGKTRSVGVH